MRATNLKAFVWLFALSAPLVAGCGGDDETEPLIVSWTFPSGDCASNKVEKIRIAYTPPGGAAATKEMACSAGSTDLGMLTKSTVSWKVNAEALDAAGVVRFTSTQSATFPDGRGGPLDIRFRPKASNVTVTWNGCPSTFVLPYFVTIYRPPAAGTTALTSKVTEAQESCDSKKATLESVEPGTYVVELDSRAQNPKIQGRADVTVVAGEDVTVNIPVPSR